MSDQFWLLVGIGFCIMLVVDAVQGDDTDEETIDEWLDAQTEQSAQQYAQGVPLSQHATYVELIEDPETARIMRVCVTVPGVGKRTAFAIAAEFEDFESFASADVERLETVNNIGPNRAGELASITGAGDG